MSKTVHLTSFFLSVIFLCSKSESDTHLLTSWHSRDEPASATPQKFRQTTILVFLTHKEFLQTLIWIYRANLKIYWTDKYTYTFHICHPQSITEKISKPVLSLFCIPIGDSHLLLKTSAEVSARVSGLKGLYWHCQQPKPAAAPSSVYAGCQRSCRTTLLHTLHPLQRGFIPSCISLQHFIAKERMGKKKTTNIKKQQNHNQCLQ